VLEVIIVTFVVYKIIKRKGDTKAVPSVLCSRMITGPGMIIIKITNKHMTAIMAAFQKAPVRSNRITLSPFREALSYSRRLLLRFLFGLKSLQVLSAHIKVPCTLLPSTSTELTGFIQSPQICSLVELSCSKYSQSLQTLSIGFFPVRYIYATRTLRVAGFSP